MIKSISLPEEGIDLNAVYESFVRQALERERGNKSRAGALLKLTYDAVASRCKTYDISSMDIRYKRPSNKPSLVESGPGGDDAGVDAE